MKNLKIKHIFTTIMIVTFISLLDYDIDLNANINEITIFHMLKVFSIIYVFGMLFKLLIDNWDKKILKK